METMQPYYRLMKSILFVLFLSFGMISCEKEDPVSTSPTTRQTDDSTTDPTDPDPTDPVVRSNNEQTVFMYLPWSNNLTSFFYQNIADLKSIIGNLYVHRPPKPLSPNLSMRMAKVYRRL